MNSPRTNHPEAVADFYVAPDGADTNPGTGTAPFATLARAQEAVRETISAGLQRDVLVLLRGGTYRVAEPLHFTSRDSGTVDHAVTYAAAQGEQVVLSGGRMIGGWQPSGGGLWTTQLPAVRAGDWSFRQLFVDGRRATRARTPNADDPTPVWTVTSATTQGEGRDTTVTVALDHPLQDWQHPSEIEMVWLYNNDGTRKRLGTIDVEQQSLTLPPPSQWVPAHLPRFYHISLPASGRTCYLENARAFLDQPGEWYLDRATGTLTYFPRPGEDLQTAEVVAPVVQNTLLEVAGTPEQPVRNLHFRGLQVQHVDWPLPPEGYVGMFGCVQMTVGDEPDPGVRWWWIDAAVTLRQAQHCSFTHGAIAHAGGIGLALRAGCAEITVEGNRIFDLGGGGIVAGLLRNRDTLRFAEPVTLTDQSGYRIVNNYIHHCGTDYAGAVGIFISLTQHSLVAHNEIHDIAYAGIVAGGNEDRTLPFAMNNTYDYNHIHRVMQVAVDGAGIYVSTGFAPPAGRTGLVRGNWIHDISANLLNARGRDNPGPFGCPGLYLDGVNAEIGLKGWEFVDNVVYRTGQEPLRNPLFLLFCTAEDQTWAGNVLLERDEPSAEVLERVRAQAGLEEGYRYLLEQ